MRHNKKWFVYGIAFFIVLLGIGLWSSDRASLGSEDESMWKAMFNQKQLQSKLSDYPDL